MAVSDATFGLGDVEIGGGTTTFLLWSRNLLNAGHIFYKTQSVTSGTGGFFNEPRTFGVEISIKQ